MSCTGSPQDMDDEGSSTFNMVWLQICRFLKWISAQFIGHNYLGFFRQLHGNYINCKEVDLLTSIAFGRHCCSHSSSHGRMRERKNERRCDSQLDYRKAFSSIKKEASLCNSLTRSRASFAEVGFERQNAAEKRRGERERPILAA